jgi:hypothetical protein
MLQHKTLSENFAALCICLLVALGVQASLFAEPPAQPRLASMGLEGIAYYSTSPFANAMRSGGPERLKRGESVCKEEVGTAAGRIFDQYQKTKPQ